MSDTIKPETYLAGFFEQLGIREMDAESMVAAFQHPQIYRPAEGMPELVEALSRNPNVQQSILSDTISVAIPPMMAQLALLSAS